MPIYITQALLQSNTLIGTENDPNNPRLGYDNKLFAGSITSANETFEHPVSNLLNTSCADYWLSDEDTAANRQHADHAGSR